MVYLIAEPSMEIVQSIFLIFVGAALFASLALFARQPLIIVYIVLGCLMGPYVLNWAGDSHLLYEIGEIGIIFLLFLVGLDLPPNKLRNVLANSIVSAVASSIVFFVIGFSVLYAFGFSTVESIIAGIAMMFSSTILGVKLLPTTVLHHRHIGEIVISLLLIQDLFAIVALLILNMMNKDAAIEHWLVTAASLPLVGIVATVGVRYGIKPLLQKFDVYSEFIFLLSIGWCLGIASLAYASGLTLEIGAFIAGVAMANLSVSQYIANALRPLRDFFLVLFFFSVGAGINPLILIKLAVPTFVLAVILIFAKPAVFQILLRTQGENRNTAKEVSIRLGQASEFSLLIVYLTVGLLTIEASHVIKGATIITLLASTYLVVFRYPNPIAVSPELRRE